MILQSTKEQMTELLEDVMYQERLDWNNLTDDMKMTIATSVLEIAVIAVRTSGGKNP